ncbi:YjbH domain-containing protein [Rhodobacter maris]|uniref:Exopolysaccharide biosynthesis protein YbjH n=1 Tax=Rhodobacter maris TaxID=446682 RepID=A0A285THL8_9RHOB|nr:YjbH domain-containing protein [Rhodobacter maris]SOC21238.1 exopolysaccharide biosynthesis protein YbjH [Rhodobacter maris]
MAQKSQTIRLTTVPALAGLCGIFLAAGGVGAQERGLGWGYNSYGIPGIIDMPSALGREDAEIGLSSSHFAGQTRNTFTFQISDRLSASFRYALMHDIRPNFGSVASNYYDRSFSVQYRFIDEANCMPAAAVGLNDLVGTGIYAGEYVVATKTFSPKVRASLGLGWGRLGSFGGFSNPLGALASSFKTRPAPAGGMGGTFQPSAWFRGDAALFGGVEWRPNDRWRLIAEYSSDDYSREDQAFSHKSPFNFGVDYRYSERTTMSARYLYGSEIGVQFTYSFNPKHPPNGSGLDAAPPPVVPRAALAGPALGIEAPDLIASARSALAAEGLALEGLERDGTTLRIQIANDRYAISSQAVGRAARVLTHIAPVAVERFDVRLSANGMPVSSVLLRRADMEALEFDSVASDLMRARSRITNAPEALADNAGRYPKFRYGFEPYLTPSLFDPDAPMRADLGVAATMRFEPMAGLVFSGWLQQKAVGNLDQTIRPSTSVLPHVRSDGYLYYKGSDTALTELTAAYYFRPGADLYGRVTVGLLERMYGGVSSELLWKPQNSRLALGAEVNWVKQRSFDKMFGFRAYDVATGHLSAYYQFNNGYSGQLDIGRYLADDTGATLTLAREFDNGWKVATFATLTNVSATTFGEGSFDKGITLTIPIDWIIGKPQRKAITTTIRPVQRDGGARLYVPGRLYETVRGQHASAFDASWGRFWK